MAREKQERKPKAEPVRYEPANDTLGPIADRLIRKDHNHLMLVKIAYVFRSKARKRAGRVVMGTACKFPPKFKPLFPEDEYDFLIEIAGDEWNKLNDYQREALLHHELSHCWCEEDEETGNMKTSLLDHDVTAFNSEMRLYGTWNDSLVEANRALRGGAA